MFSFTNLLVSKSAPVLIPLVGGVSDDDGFKFITCANGFFIAPFLEPNSHRTFVEEIAVFLGELL